MSSTQGRTFTAVQLSLPGKKTCLPAAVPLIIGNNFRYNSENYQLEEVQEEFDETSSHKPSLQLLPDALDLLRTIKKPVAVVAVCGPYRTGKSYLLSRILGIPGAFKVGHTTSACTHGIWMATQVLECDEFSLLLLDTEGIDAVSGTGSNDARVLVMAILLSSYFIYNSIHVPRKDDLEKMRYRTIINWSSVSTNFLKFLRKVGSVVSAKLHNFSYEYLMRDITRTVN